MQTHVDVVAASTGRNEINTASFSTSFTTLQQLGLQDHLAGSQELHSPVYISVSEVTLIWLTLINCSKTVQFLSRRALTWFFFSFRGDGNICPARRTGKSVEVLDELVWTDWLWQMTSNARRRVISFCVQTQTLPRSHGDRLAIVFLFLKKTLNNQIKMFFCHSIKFE